MARTVVRLNHGGMRALLNSPGVADHVRDLADPVLAAARANAPVATGAYRDSLRVWSTRTDRAVARVGSDVGHAFAVEAKTGNLSRALDAAG